jgi:hypothetical protein
MFVWLLARPRRSKELEILVLRHELAIPASAGSAAEADSGGSCAAGSAEPLAATGVVGELSGEAGHLAALAPPTRSTPLDLLAQEVRQTAARTVAARHDPPPRPREPALGLPTHRRGASGRRGHRLGHLSAEGAARRRLQPSPERTRSSRSVGPEVGHHLGVARQMAAEDQQLKPLGPRPRNGVSPSDPPAKHPGARPRPCPRRGGNVPSRRERRTPLPPPCGGVRRHAAYRA